MEIKDFELEPGVPVGLAASMLHVSTKRIYQLLGVGRLDRAHYDGAVGVTLASIKRRHRWLSARNRRAKKSAVANRS
jgi:hypothetical protein